MKSFYRVVLVLTFLLIIISGVQAREVIVVPRTPERLPRARLQRHRSPEIDLVRLPPALRGEEILPVDTPPFSPDEPLKEPDIIFNITAGEYLPKITDEPPRRKTGEQFYHVTGQIPGISWARVHLYETRGGFFEVYDEEDMDKLGSDFLDREGNFRIGPVKYTEGWFYRGKDIVLILELSSPYAVAYSEMYGIERPFRYEMATRRRVVPEDEKYELGRIDIDWSKPEYYHVRAYRQVVERMRERDIADRVKIEFTRDVDEPQFMERIGYVLMPYHN